MSSFLSKARTQLEGTVLGNTGFLFHFSTYVLVNAILIAVNLIFTPGKLWFIWPLLGWGIGLLAHGLAMTFSQKEAVRRRGRERSARVAGTSPAGTPKAN